MAPAAKHSNHEKKEHDMKQPTCASRIIRSSLALVLALAIWSPLQAQSASHMEGKNMTAAEMMDRCEKMQAEKQMERCQEMQAEKQKMMADMKAQDAELTAQLAKMNSAPKDQKVDLLAAVVTSMVEKRIATDARMAKMQEKMMQHMMQHMQMGKDSMAQCPMMKDMDNK
jgi:hypothetical protein